MNKILSRQALPLLLAMGLSTGCSVTVTQSSPTPPATTSATATRPSVPSLALPSPTGATLTLAQSVDRYEKIVEPRNAAAREVRKVQDAKQPWTAHQTAVTRLFDAEDAAMVELAGTAWPGEIRPLVDALVESKSANRLAMYAAVSARTESEYLTALADLGSPAECHALSALKVALGLPAVPNCPGASA